MNYLSTFKGGYSLGYRGAANNITPASRAVVSSAGLSRIAAATGFAVGRFVGSGVYVGRAAVSITGYAFRQLVGASVKIRNFVTSPKRSANLSRDVVAEKIGPTNKPTGIKCKLVAAGKEIKNIGKDIKESAQTIGREIKNEYAKLRARRAKRQVRKHGFTTKPSVGAKVGMGIKAFYRGRAKAARTNADKTANSKLFQNVRDFKNEAFIVKGAIGRGIADTTLAAAGIIGGIWAAGDSKEEDLPVTEEEK